MCLWKICLGLIAFRHGCIVGAVGWNLFDIDAKFGDVEPFRNNLACLDSNDLQV